MFDHVGRSGYGSSCSQGILDYGSYRWNLDQRVDPANPQSADRHSEVNLAKQALIQKQQGKPKFKVRAYNRCRICGRPRAFIRQYGICRICFRELAHRGHIPGVTKASW